jgi:hypothetical protein
LKAASDILDKRSEFSNNALFTALAGTIGGAAAHELQLYLNHYDELTSLTAIIENPAKAKLPKDGLLQSIMAHRLVSQVTVENMDKIQVYVNRLNLEIGVFYASTLMNSSKRTFLIKSKAFMEFAKANTDLFVK